MRTRVPRCRCLSERYGIREMLFLNRLGRPSLHEYKELKKKRRETELEPYEGIQGIRKKPKPLWKRMSKRDGRMGETPGQSRNVQDCAKTLEVEEGGLTMKVKGERCFQEREATLFNRVNDGDGQI